MRVWPGSPCRRGSALAVRPRSAAATVVALLAAAAAPGDIFHLANGSTVEGELISQAASMYTIRATTGTLSLPTSAVERVETALSPFAEYNERVAAVSDSADANFELAEWCDERGLPIESRKHLERAVALNPNHAAARRALGYVRVGSLWVDGRSMLGRADGKGAKAADAERDAEKLIKAIQADWRRKVRGLKTALESGLDRQSTDARGKLTEIRDPLAILPLTQGLSKGRASTRALLADLLGAFVQDDATLNLTVMALIDPDSGVRRRAILHLSRREDARIGAQLARALQSENDQLVRRAANALGELKCAEAVPKLIDALVTERDRWVEEPVVAYFGAMPTVFSGVSLTIGAGVSVATAPIIGVSGVADVENVLEWKTVTVFRTEVLEALKRITGQNFGFEQSEWSRWYEEHRS